MSGKKSTSKKTKQHSPPKSLTQSKIKDTQGTSKYLRIPKKVFGLIVSLMAVAGFLFLVYPRISIYSGEILNPSDPFETPLIIKNDGHLPIRNIHYLMSNQVIKLINNNYIGSNKLDIYQGAISELKTNRTTTIFIKRFIKVTPNSIISAEFDIELKYKSYLLPFFFTDKFHFKTVKNVNGKYIWMEYYGGPK